MHACPGAAPKPLQPPEETWLTHVPEHSACGRWRMGPVTLGQAGYFGLPGNIWRHQTDMHAGRRAGTGVTGDCWMN